MTKHIANTTQGAHPWRATFRTVLVALIALAATAEVIYAAIAQGDPGAATGGAAVALGIAGALTRVLAVPAVDAFLVRFVPWLSAAGRAEPDAEPDEPESIPGTTLDLGATEADPERYRGE